MSQEQERQLLLDYGDDQEWEEWQDCHLVAVMRRRNPGRPESEETSRPDFRQEKGGY